MRYAILLIACLLGGCFSSDKTDTQDDPITIPVLY